MIAIVLKTLTEINNPISDKLVNIFENKQDSVSDDFYATTVFENQGKYTLETSVFSGQMFGYFNKPIVDTPLAFVRGNFPYVFPSCKNQGVAFGLTMVDYISKKPYIVIVADKTTMDKTYSLKTLVYDLKTKSYEETSVNLICENLTELLDVFKYTLENIINNFITK